METIKVQWNDLSKTSTPFLSYCRKLIKDGKDPNCRLEAYRGDRLDMWTNNIGESAKWTVKEEPSVHFAPFKGMSNKAKIALGKNIGI